jgi:SPP1 gp7 family putative phage head morphogenesis protein
MKKIKLTKKKAQWYKDRNKKVVNGKPLHPNIQIEDKMSKQLEKIVNAMTKDVAKSLESLFKQDNINMTFDADISSAARILINKLNNKWAKIFKDKSTTISDTMVNSNERFASSTVFSSLKELSGGLSIKTSDISTNTKMVMKASTQESANLIKSIATKYLNDIAGQTYRSITSGQGLKDLIPYLEKQKGVTNRRAKNIALDQTRKTYSNVTNSKMQDAGIKKFKWIHSASSAEPRKEHMAHNGKIYSFDDLPLYNGIPDYPSWQPYCRCIAVPVLEFEED